MALIIIIGALALSAFLILFGAVTNQAGILSTGTAILGALLGAAGIKYQPQIQAVMCKLGIHDLRDDTVDDLWKVKRCVRDVCNYSRKERIT
jgi:hypothetical protein